MQRPAHHRSSTTAILNALLVSALPDTAYVLYCTDACTGRSTRPASRHTIITVHWHLQPLHTSRILEVDDVSIFLEHVHLRHRNEGRHQGKQSDNQSRPRKLRRTTRKHKGTGKRHPSQTMYGNVTHLLNGRQRVHAQALQRGLQLLVISARGLVCRLVLPSHGALAANLRALGNTTIHLYQTLSSNATQGHSKQSKIDRQENQAASDENAGRARRGQPAGTPVDRAKPRQTCTDLQHWQIVPPIAHEPLKSPRHRPCRKSVVGGRVDETRQPG
jgi:hypothetical protein